MFITHPDFSPSSGRLGNQLFQIAAILHIAHLNHATPLLPAWNLAPWLAGRSLFSHRELPENTHHYHEPESSYWKYRPPRFHSSGHIQLHGYFQSYRYAGPLRGILNGILSPTPKLNQLLVREANELPPAYISIHVRRTDFITDGCTHLPPPAFYTKGIKMMPRSLPVVIFTDDAAWCEANVVLPERTVQIRGRRYPDNFDTSVQDLVDLLLMARARHFVLSTSTFGWWGAWLSPYSDSKVIIPHRWRRQS